jgi:hypothetical protein
MIYADAKQEITPKSNPTQNKPAPYAQQAEVSIDWRESATAP